MAYVTPEWLREIKRRSAAWQRERSASIRAAKLKRAATETTTVVVSSMLAKISDECWFVADDGQAYKPFELRAQVKPGDSVVVAAKRDSRPLGGVR